MQNMDKKTVIKLLLLAFLAIFLMTGSWRIIQSYYSLEDDSLSEEFVEEVIEDVAGVDIDLSPSDD